MLLLFVPASVLFGVLIFLFLVSPYGRRTLVFIFLFSVIPAFFYGFGIISEKGFIVIAAIAAIACIYTLEKLDE